MATANEIRNRLIDSLLAIDDPKHLKAIEELIRASHMEHTEVPLSEEQKMMLAMSDEDTKSENLIDQNTLNEQELEWLKRR